MRLIPGCFAALILAAPQTAAAQDSVTAQARVAIARGDAAAAIDLLERHLADRPRDADAMRVLASAYAAERRYVDAFAVIDRAAHIAPADLDIRLARARILFWSGQLRAARAEVETAAATRPDYPDLIELRRAIAAAERAPHRTVFSYSQAVSTVANGGRDRTWWDSILAGYTNISRATTLAGEAEREDRAGIVDTRLSLRIDSTVSRALALHAGVAATIDPDFRERYSIGGGLEAKLSAAATFLLDAKHSDYRAAATTAIEPAIRLRAAPRLDVTARWINLIDSTGSYRTGGALRADYALRHEWSLYAGAALYPDTEAGITRRTWSAYAGASLPVTGRLRVRVDAGYDRREDSYTRRTLAIGLAWRLASEAR